SDGRGAEARGVAPGEFLGQTEGDELLSLGDRAEEAVLLLLGPADQDWERSERVHGIEHADASARARQLLHADAEVDDAPARAAVLLRNPDSHEARLRDRLLDIPGVFLQSIVFRRERTHHLLRDRARSRAPYQILLGENSGQRFPLSGGWVCCGCAPRARCVRHDYSRSPARLSPEVSEDGGRESRGATRRDRSARGWCIP